MGCPPMTDRTLTEKEVLRLSASAIRKVHNRGPRGVEMITQDEAVALVGMVLDLSKQALAQEFAREDARHA